MHQLVPGTCHFAYPPWSQETIACSAWISMLTYYLVTNYPYQNPTLIKECIAITCHLSENSTTRLLKNAKQLDSFIKHKHYTTSTDYPSQPCQNQSSWPPTHPNTCIKQPKMLPYHGPQPSTKFTWCTVTGKFDSAKPIPKETTQFH